MGVRRRAWLDFLVYLVVRMLVCVVQSLSVPACAVCCRWLATLSASILKIRRRVVEENLQLAFPEMSVAERKAIAWRMWEHLFLLLVEIAHAPRKIHDTNWREYVTFHNHVPLVEALLSDRPTVIVCGHYGNFELSGVTMGILGFPSFTIARTLDNPYLDRYINKFRGCRGQYILPKNGSAPQIDALLERGGTLVFLADQHAGPKGCWVDFFGRPASTHKAIGLFSLSNDVAAGGMLCPAQGRAAAHHVGPGRHSRSA